ncbi:class I SAM-dependent methyltransferase [Chloroflexota bacterium]
MKFLRKVDHTVVGGEELWQEHWSKQDTRKLIRHVEEDPVTMIVRKWIEDTTIEGETPKILDGGCGVGRHLIYFDRLGYDVTGVDFSDNAIEAVKGFDDRLKVIQAGVIELPFASLSFDYYLSFGVLEHFIDGLTQGLNEAHRVLKPNGILFLSVPYMNWSRILYECLGNLSNKLTRKYKKQQGMFYQYYFSKKELSTVTTSLGLKVVKSYPLNQELGLLRGIPFVRKNRFLNYLALTSAKLIKHFLPWFTPHMVLLICKKVV